MLFEAAMANEFPLSSELELSQRDLGAELTDATGTPRQRALKQLALAAVGAVPWVGVFLVAAAEFQSKDGEVNEILRLWLEQHGDKFKKLERTIADMAKRLESFDERIDKRLESPEYLALVDKGFRTWDSVSTEEKRDYVRRLLENAAATELCSDDLVRLFLSWIEQYDETHFKVMRAIFNREDITRLGIWRTMHSSIPRDDSQEADLFKLLIDDLVLGHVIRQTRETNEDGQFLAKRPVKTRIKSTTMKSPFDDVKGYELTELGKKFIHYVMKDVAPQLGHKQA